MISSPSVSGGGFFLPVRMNVMTVTEKLSGMFTVNKKELSHAETDGKNR